MKKPRKIKETIKTFGREPDGKLYPWGYPEKDVSFKEVIRYSDDQTMASYHIYHYDGTSFCYFIESNNKTIERPTEKIFYSSENENGERREDGQDWVYKHQYEYDEYGDEIRCRRYKASSDEIACEAYTVYTRNEYGDILLKVTTASYSFPFFWSKPELGNSCLSYCRYTYNQYRDLVRIEDGRIDDKGNYLPPTTIEEHSITYHHEDV